MNRDITEAQRAWLEGELAAWRAIGLISDDQARAVISLYGTEAEAADRRRSRAISILLFLAALLSALGVILLIAYNWQAIPAAIKIVLILSAVTAAHGTGLWLHSQKGSRTAAEVAFFLGCLLYGAGIGLIGQIFHIPANDAGAFWWWALGVLPFVLALDSIPFHVLYVGLAGIWVGYEILGFGNLGAWLFGRWSFMPNGAYSLLALAAPGFALSYRRNDPRTLAIYVPLIAWWVILQPFAWRFDENPAFLIGAVGGLLLLAAELHREGSAMAVPYRFFGAVLVGGTLVPLSFQGFHRLAWRAAPEVFAVLGGPAVIVTLALGLLAAAAWLRQRRDAMGGGTETASLAWHAREIVRRAWLPVALISFFALMGFWRLITGGESVVPTITANIAMLALAFWIMRIGLREDRGQPFAAGVGYFLLWTLLRYFDLFGDFGGMLGAAAMFFLCGASLFGVAFFWRRRKEAGLA